MNILEVISLVLGSGTIGSVVTAYLNKGKNNAETQTIIAQTQTVIGKAYSDLIDELRNSIDYQGKQILSMQERENTLLKIIQGHRDTERDLRNQIKDLESKLSKRMDQLETQP